MGDDTSGDVFAYVQFDIKDMLPPILTKVRIISALLADAIELAIVIVIVIVIDCNTLMS